jgi:hypothetical protein
VPPRFELITYREQASAHQIRALLRALEESTSPTRTTEAENGTLETAVTVARAREETRSIERTGEDPSNRRARSVAGNVPPSP